MRELKAVCTTAGQPGRVLQESKVLASFHKRLPEGEYEAHELDTLKQLHNFADYFDKMSKYDRAKYDRASQRGGAVNAMGKRCHTCGSTTHLKADCPQNKTKFTDGGAGKKGGGKAAQAARRKAALQKLIEKRSKIPCRDFLAGKCKRGDKCHFKHPDGPTQSTVLCMICQQSHVGKICPIVATLKSASMDTQRELAKLRKRVDKSGARRREHEDDYHDRRRRRDSTDMSDDEVSLTKIFPKINILAENMKLRPLTGLAAAHCPLRRNEASGAKIGGGKGASAPQQPKMLMLSGLRHRARKLIPEKSPTIKTNMKHTDRAGDGRPTTLQHPQTKHSGSKRGRGAAPKILIAATKSLEQYMTRPLRKVGKTVILHD